MKTLWDLVVFITYKNRKYNNDLTGQFEDKLNNIFNLNHEILVTLGNYSMFDSIIIMSVWQGWT